MKPNNPFRLTLVLGISELFEQVVIILNHLGGSPNLDPGLGRIIHKKQKGLIVFGQIS